MPKEKPILWLGKQKEKRALKLSKEHMNEIVKVVEAMKELVYSFSKGERDLETKSKKVMDEEKKADSKKAEVIDELSKGNFPPLNREMIIRLIMTTDDIADNARAASAKLTFLNPKNIDDDVKKGLKNLADLAFESSKLLEEAFSLLIKDPEKAIEKTEEVEKIEEKADYFRAKNLTPLLVKWADDSQKPGTSYFLWEVEDNIEEVLDQSENSADVIREIAIGVL